MSGFCAGSLLGGALVFPFLRKDIAAKKIGKIIAKGIVPVTYGGWIGFLAGTGVGFILIY